MSKHSVVFLKDYIKEPHGSLADKIVVGPDIKPSEAVNLAIEHSPIQVITEGFDECRVVRIKDDVDQFLNDPVRCLIDRDEDTRICFEQDFLSYSSKQEFLAEVEDFLKTSKFRKVREDIYLIADELFTNFAKSAKDDQTSMKFGIESNQDTVVIYCRDSFGTLRPNDMLTNMKRCFDKGVMGAIKKEEGKGAGIGSYLIYTLGVGMAITVQPDKGSLVSIWMPRNIHHEDRLELNKSLIIIEAKGA